MINRADQTARIRQHPRQHQPADHPAEQHRAVAERCPTTATSGRTKPVRRSVDLSPSYHARLTEWCAETGDEIGARVTGQAVIRALVARLLMDEHLARRIRADLRISI
ncbi:MAG: hypothetical protein ACT4NY_18605 [Pseudonocardiales bacterium]